MLSLAVTDLRKDYPRKPRAIDGLSITLGPGVLGLLGPNGAGKSTLMRILATVAKPTSGSATWNGTDIVKHPNAIREVLGYLPQDFGVYPNLNAVEFLSYLAAVRGIAAGVARKRIDELLVLVNLVESSRRPLSGFSGGMRQRLGIAQALLNDPRLLIVDEPTVGLDPEALLSDLTRLLAGGVTEEVLVAYIEQRKLSRPLTVDEILTWKNAGIPDAAIKAATRP